MPSIQSNRVEGDGGSGPPDADGILAGLSAAGQAPAADSVGRFAQLRAWKDSF